VARLWAEHPVGVAEQLPLVTCAPIARTIRGIGAEVEVGPEQGLPEVSAIACGNLLTLPQAVLDPLPVGRLDAVKRVELDGALRYALGIRY
jgi:mRNA interferase MazF